MKKLSGYFACFQLCPSFTSRLQCSVSCFGAEPRVWSIDECLHPIYSVLSLLDKTSQQPRLCVLCKYCSSHFLMIHNEIVNKVVDPDRRKVILAFIVFLLFCVINSFFNVNNYFSTFCYSCYFCNKYASMYKILYLSSSS